MPTISYILAAYRGPRGVADPHYARDPDRYLRKQLQSLETLRHSLSEIIVVLNEDGATPLALPKTIGNVPLRVERRPNRGLSYGAFARGVEIADSEYVLLMEDDYMFVVDDFDKHLLERIQSKPRQGFCAGAVSYERTAQGPHPKGAAVFLGLASTEATRDILRRGYDGGSIVREDNGRAAGWHSQVAWSRSYMVAGYSLLDWIDNSYACATWVTETHQLIWFDQSARPDEKLPRPATPMPAATASTRVLVGGRSSTRVIVGGGRRRPMPTGKPRMAPLPDVHATRRSLVVPQQALDYNFLDVEIGGNHYRAKICADGRLR